MSKQFGIKEVLDLDFFDFTTGDPIFRADYCQNSSLKTSAERLDIRGGQGNYKLLSFDHTKTSEMMFESAIVDTVLLGKLAGKDTSIGVVEVPTRELLTSSGATPTITLSATPVAGTLQIWKITDDRDISSEQTLGTPTTTVNTYSIASSTIITLNATSGVAGTKFACYYDYSAPATTETITVTANAFPSYMKAVGKGLMTDLVSGATVPVVFELMKIKPKNDFEISLKSDAATQLNMSFDLFSVDDAAGDKVYFKYYMLK
jgi:hypothetical protein